MNAQGLLGTGESSSSSATTQVAQYRGAATGPTPNGDALSRLAAADPQTFGRVMDTIADELQSIADTTEGPRHNFLSAMANRFATATAHSRPLPEVATVTPQSLTSPAGAGPKDSTVSSGSSAVNANPHSNGHATAIDAARDAHRHHHHRHHHRGLGAGKPALHSAENLVAKIVDAVNSALSNRPLSTAVASNTVTPSTASTSSNPDATSTATTATDEA